MNNDKKKIIEGIKVTSLNRAVVDLFNEVYDAVKGGSPRQVLVEASSGDVERLNISIVRADGIVENKTTFGKSKADTDFPAGLTFNEVKEMLNTPHTAEVYGVEGNCVLLRIKELESLKDTSKGFDDTGSIEKEYEALWGKDIIDTIHKLLMMHGIKKGSLLYKLIFEKMKPTIPHIPVPKYLYLPVKGEESALKRALEHIVVGNYPVLDGPKSVGKGVLVHSLAFLLNMPESVGRGGEGMTSADLLGFPTTDITYKKALTQEGLNAKMEAMRTGVWTDEALAYQLALDKSQSPDLVFTPGPVTKALELTNAGTGAILVLDEMNHCNPSALAEVMNVLADKHSEKMFITGYGYIDIPDDLIIVGTQNTNKGNDTSYVTTLQQDGATKSRFATVEMYSGDTIIDCLRKDAEKWGVPDTILYGMDAVYSEFKKLAELGEDSITADCLNIRGFMSAIRTIGIGKSFFDSINEGVIGSCNEDDKETLREAVKNLCDKHGNYRPKGI